METIKLVIAGGGFVSHTTAHQIFKLCRKHKVALSITVVGNSEDIIYQPGQLFVPFNTWGYRSPADLTWSVRDVMDERITFICDTITRIDRQNKKLDLAGGESVPYDFLVVALGATLVTDDEEIPGLGTAFEKIQDPNISGTNLKVHGFYTMDSAFKLKDGLKAFTDRLKNHSDGKPPLRIIINVAALPYKCPVAPLELALLLDTHFSKLGLRDKVVITVVTPLSGAFTKPVCNKVLTDYLVKERGIEVIANYNLGEVQENLIICDDPNDLREVPFDLAIIIPPHEGSEVLEEAGLSDDLGFGSVDPKTLQSKKDPYIFILGDVAGVPTSKAGSVGHFMGEVVGRRILDMILCVFPNETYDGHANCFIAAGAEETQMKIPRFLLSTITTILKPFGVGVTVPRTSAKTNKFFKLVGFWIPKAFLIDFNYETQPVSGWFPFRWGMLRLLDRPTYLNYVGKMFFKLVYRYALLKGCALPFVSHEMSTAGKDMHLLETVAETK